MRAPTLRTIGWTASKSLSSCILLSPIGAWVLATQQNHAIIYLSQRGAAFCFIRGSVFIVFILAIYSGYIVSAPPRAASGGTPDRAGNSSRNGFVPDA